ncbi:MAG TPA: glycosyltransferase family 4 protein, partial [Rariglobus sp.]
MAAPLPRRIAFVGTYVPRKCGIGTFTQDLCEAIAGAAPTAHCFVGAMNDRAEGYAYPARVSFEIQEKDIDSYRRAADFVNFNNADVLCVQHEFGIFGGPAGSHLLALLKDVRMPVVTTLHSVLREPDFMQRKVMAELVQRSDRLVVMAGKGTEILREVYDVPEEKIVVIPHGIPDMPFLDSSVFKAQFDVEGRRVLLTFGLLGPSKGIEHVIAALPEIVKRHPDVVYLILGATHPRLIAREGESYRLKLERLTDDLGVKDHVVFYNRYVSLDNLKEFIGATDIYLTPYLNEAQITSGTLAYVFGAGKAVVSTPYWHAQELLADGRGLLVPFRDPSAIARAVCTLLDDADRMEQIRRDAYALGRKMIWPEVANRYLEVFRQVHADLRKTAPRAAPAGPAPASRHYELPPLRLDHLLRMSDDTGILQHAIFNVPNFHEGYCTDDNARAFILCVLLDEIGEQPAAETLDKPATRYLAFLAAAFDPNIGRFRNHMSHRRDWREEIGSEDCHGRALWALGTGAGHSLPENQSRGRLSALLFKQGLNATAGFTSPRAWAFTLLGIHEYLLAVPADPEALAMRELLIGKLLQLWKTCATDDWPWFEPIVSYENARLPQALILGGRLLPHPE